MQGLQMRKDNFVFLRNTLIEISLIPLFVLAIEED